MRHFSWPALLGLLMILISGNDLRAQRVDIWSPVSQAPTSGERRIIPDDFELLRADFATLKAELRRAPAEGLPNPPKSLSFLLPNPNGEMEAFQVWKVRVLHPTDEGRFPNTRTFIARGIDDPYAYARLDFTPHGFHAMVLTRGGSWWIDPYAFGNTEYYMAYRKSDLQPRAGEDYACHSLAEGLATGVPQLNLPKTPTLPTGGQLRQYDLALTCVGEYAQFHGGTVPQVQGAMVTTINRVSGIFERDMTIRLVFIPNNDTLIYTDPATDPYPCCNLGPILGIGRDVIDSLIGLSNIGLGHTFTTYGGGLAAFGVCENPRATAGTGLTQPVGDPFDVDYVSHEIGHQFHGSHTFNYCPGQGGVPHEPGSGSTIMAYAGLCGTANMQTFSVDAFSVGTYEEVINFTHFGAGNTCPTTIATGNTPPTIEAPTGGFYIPKSTPFELTGHGQDLDGDSLTYSWEQFDLGPNTHPDTSVGNCPLFRVLWPTNDSTRVFPQISDVVTGNVTIGEQLPAYGREMNFRCAIRDNRGGADYDDIKFYVADSSGPFRVLSPNAVGIGWTVGSVQTVTWDVAGSDQSPVNCGQVDIYLSADGGYTSPLLLAAARPNNGATAITVPNLPGSQYRIKVKGHGNHFFDISDADFAIFPASTPDYTMTVNDPSLVLCGGDTGTYAIELDTLGAFGDPVSLSVSGLPAGVGHSFSSNGVTPPGTVLLSVWNTTASPGNVALNLQASSTSGVKTMPLNLGLRSGNVPAVSLVSPPNGSTNQSVLPQFNWNGIPFSQFYRLQLDISPSFSAPILDVPVQNATSYLSPLQLQNNEVYYWRVQVDSADCGSGPWGATYSFQTPAINCQTYASTDVPVGIAIPTPDTVYSTLTVPTSLTISDVNVTEMEGDHTWVSDLRVTLTSPQNTSVQLFAGLCGDNDDFDLRFDDTSSVSQIPCPPTTGDVYLPDNPLAQFNGQNAQGTWTLEVIDAIGQDGGNLNAWSLEICGPPINPGVPNLNTQILVVNQGDSAVIGTVYLNLTCPGSGSVAYYTLVGLPAHGTLTLNGAPLAPGDSISQADVDAGLLQYAHDGTATTADAFPFTALCSNGGYLGGLNFPITVTNVVGISSEHSTDWQLYPNPASGSVKVRRGNWAGNAWSIRVFNAQGQLVRERIGSQSEEVLSLEGLPAGLYAVEVRENGASQGSRNLIIQR